MQKLVTKFQSTDFVQSVMISKDTANAELEVGGQIVKFISPPFNPIIPLDDLLRDNPSAQALVVAFDLGTYAAFMVDFANWLKASNSKAPLHIMVLGNRAEDASVKNVAEVSHLTTPAIS